MCGIFGLFFTSLNKTIGVNKSSIYTFFNNMKQRGPDNSLFLDINNALLGFHRLSINDISYSGNQPFVIDDKNRKIISICNGEIYNSSQLKQKYCLKLNSNSDCECLPHLYKDRQITNMLQEIRRNEFAFLIIDIKYNENTDDIDSINIIAARDPFGVKPLFYNEQKDYIVFSSIMKSIPDFNQLEVKEVKPGHFINININKQSYTINEIEYYKPTIKLLDNDFNKIHSLIVTTLTDSVKSRLISDVSNIGCFLSGGLDSSLVAAIAASELKKKNKVLHTFSIGFQNSPDIKAAALVAKYIESNHTEIIIEPMDCLKLIPTVIKTIESYDITTVRASLPQYLISKYVSEKTSIKVILTGEGADELCFGYMLFHLTEDQKAANDESDRLIKNLHKYDIVRGERCTSENGLEIRIPFLDCKFVELYKSINPSLKMPMKATEMKCMSSIVVDVNKKIEKGLLREAFFKSKILPLEILTRKKDAFSDAISDTTKSLFQYIGEFCQLLITDQEFTEQSVKYQHNMPVTKESYYYRKLYEAHFGKKNEKHIETMWRHAFTNKNSDPSARLLDVYKT